MPSNRLQDVVPPASPKQYFTHMNSLLRAELVATALRWEHRFGNAPSITSVLSEYDAAMLVGMSEDEYRPRNNRTNKALKSLGYDVRLFSD